MPTAAYGVSLQAGGVSIQQTITRTSDGVIAVETTLPAGKAGTLSTRTDDNTGEATLSASHGITDSDVVDVYWDGGVRYGMTAGTVSGNDVPLDGGSGDNLPAQATAVVVTKQVQVNVSIDGDELAILGVVAEYTDQASTAKAHADFQDSGSASIEAITFTANAPQVWDIEGGATNVFTGNPVTKVKASNGSSSASATLKICGIVDATP